MFGVQKPTPALLAELDDFLARLRDVQPSSATQLGELLEASQAAAKPDLTSPLLKAAEFASAAEVALGTKLTAAACRAGSATLRERFPGGLIELRVPPVSAVQIGFGSGGQHTRGTPPNVVETDPETYLGLLTGRLTWAEATPKLQVTGVHAAEASRVFPL